MSSKRKRTDPKIYVVRNGFKPGLYFTWSDCLAQVTGFKNAIFKSFTTIADAEAFLSGRDPTEDDSKFYAVKNGRIPGIYSSWTEAQKQIKGWTKPKYRLFTTRAEAESFVRGEEGNGAKKDDKKAKVKAEEFHDPDADPSLQLLSEAGLLNDAGKAPRKKQKMSASGSGATQSEKSSQQSRLSDNDELFVSSMGALASDEEDTFSPTITSSNFATKRGGKPKSRTQTKLLQIKGSKSEGILRIYTDGSSLGNGKGGAVAGVGVFFGVGDVRNISEPLAGSRQTNNRAELTAILRALDIAPRDRAVCIYTDSSYSINCVTTWFQSWRRNNWTSTNGKSVENRDLIEAILDRIDDRKTLEAATTFQWLKGHANNEGNIEADKLAVKGAQNARVR